MAKIYNIQSNTISQEEFVKLVEDQDKDIFLLNEDLRYEIIDLDKFTVLKSRNYTKNLFAVYILIKKGFNALKIKLPKFKKK